MKSKLELYKVVPNFSLPSTEDRDIQITDYKQKKNLLLYFYSSGQCINCLERLRSFAVLYESYKKTNTEILAISSDQVVYSKLIKKEYRIPFPLLSDAEEKQMGKFTEVINGGAVPSVLILNRFGSLYGQWIVAHEEGDLPDDKKFLQLLEYIETQCPECGISPEEKSA